MVDMGVAAEDYWRGAIARQYKMVSPDYGITQHLAPMTLDMIEKGITTATGGAFNPLFSYSLISGIVTEARTWHILPHVTWRTRTLGWRNKTAAAIASGVGSAETVTAVPADIDSTYQEITPTIKELLQATGVSIRMREAATIADVVTENQHVMSVLEDVMRAQNADLMVALATVESDNVEGLRNLLSSNGEITAKTLAANSVDPWENIDRDAAAGFSDANTLFGVAGANRDLEISLLDQLYENQRPFWDNPNNKIYITRDDTMRRWSELEEAKQRLGTETVQITMGGIRSAKGQEVGVRVGAYKGDYVFEDDQMTSDGVIGDIMYLDLDHVYIAELLPLQTVAEDNLFVNGPQARTAFYGIWELLMDKWGGQGVLTDLQ